MSAPAPPDRAPRFLLLQYEIPLGTAAIGTALPAAIKARRPDAWITVAAAGLPANVLKSSPYVDELIVTPHPLKAFPAALRFFLMRVWPRRRQFDYVLADSGNQRSKTSLLAIASGVRRRVGFAVRPRLFHTGLTIDPALSNIDNSLKVLDAVGLPGPAQGPAIHFSPADLGKAEALIAEGGVGRGPVIAMVTQTSKGHPNAWFDDRWIDLSRRLIDALNARLIFIGAKADQPAIDAIRQGVKAPTLSVAGRTDIPELAALMSQCDLVVSIDTGGLHVARGVNAPTVVLGHSATPKHQWLPLDQPLFRILLHDHVPCALCRKPSCATRECMQESTVDMVEQAIADQLAAYPPSPKAHAARAAARTFDPVSRPAAPAGR